MKINTLMSKAFQFSQEIKPPASADIRLYEEKMEQVDDKISLISIPEVSDSEDSMSGLNCVSNLNPRKYDFETVYELPTRDMNSLALKSHLLSAKANGVDNILVTEGILPSENTEVVYELDSLSMLDLMKSFSDFCPGVVLNPYGHMEIESRRLWSKLEMGAQFIRTLPIFDTSRISRFVREYESTTGEDIRDLIMVSIIPPESHEQLNILKEKYNYIIPRRVFNRMKQADSEEGIQMTHEWIEEAKGKGFGGVHLHESAITNRVVSQM